MASASESLRFGAKKQLQFELNELGSKHDVDCNYNYDYVADFESDDSTNHKRSPAQLDIASLLQAMPLNRKSTKRSRGKKTPATVASPSAASLPVEDHESHSAETVAEPSHVGDSRGGDDNNGTMRAERNSLPRAIHHSVLGPSPKGTLIIKASEARAIAVVLFTADSIQVVPIAGCRSSMDLEKLEGEVRMRLSMPAEGTKLQRYRGIYDQLTALEPVWTQLFEDIATPAKTDHDGSTLLRQAFDRVMNPAGSTADPYQLFVSWAESEEPKGRYIPEEEAKHEHPHAATNVTCLICFDRLHEERDISRLEPCGHCVCADCLTAYIQSVASSGLSATISCPAHKCAESIGLFDAAHVLFGSDASLPECDAASIFERLVSNELEGFCTQENGGRYCPAPNCGRLLTPAPKPMTSGWNVMLCSCGATLCSDCPKGAKSHPGMSCSQYKKLRDEIDSGKADAEYQSYQYVLSNSRPCPRCSFAIEKDGGCNHIWCSKCQFYFCWQCGGPGNFCRSYICNNSNELWHQKPDGNPPGYDRLESKVRMYRSYRQSEDRLARLNRAISNNDSCKLSNADNSQRIELFALEHQLEQALVWIRAVLLDKDSVQHGESCPQLQRLELIVHAHAIRMRILSSQKDPDDYTGGTYSEEQVAQAMGVVDGAKMKKVTTRHKKSVDSEKNRSPPDRGYAELIADQELRELCTMKRQRFYRAAGESIQETVCFLLAHSIPSSKGRQRRKEKKVPLEIPGELNEKSERSRDPWKNGMRVAEGSTVEPAFKPGRWKGKSRVKSLRTHALDSSDI